VLIIKVFVNNTQIDEIHIQNVKHWYKNSYVYEVKHPKGVKRKFIHDRVSGWKELAKQVLEYMVNRDDKSTED